MQIHQLSEGTCFRSDAWGRGIILYHALDGTWVGTSEGVVLFSRYLDVDAEPAAIVSQENKELILDQVPAGYKFNHKGKFLTHVAEGVCIDREGNTVKLNRYTYIDSLISKVQFHVDSRKHAP